MWTSVSLVKGRPERCGIRRRWLCGAGHIVPVRCLSGSVSEGVSTLLCLPLWVSASFLFCLSGCLSVSVSASFLTTHHAQLLAACSSQAQLLACMRAKSHQLYPTLCYLLDCSLPGSSVRGVLQARILKWLAIPISRGSSRARD